MHTHLHIHSHVHTHNRTPDRQEQHRTRCVPRDRQLDLSSRHCTHTQNLLPHIKIGWREAEMCNAFHRQTDYSLWSKRVEMSAHTHRRTQTDRHTQTHTNKHSRPSAPYKDWMKRGWVPTDRQIILFAAKRAEMNKKLSFKAFFCLFFDSEKNINTKREKFGEICWLLLKCPYLCLVNPRLIMKTCA